MIHQFLENAPEAAAAIAAVTGLGVGVLVVRWVRQMLAAERLPGASLSGAAWVIVIGTSLLFGGFTWATLAWECQRAVPEVQPEVFWRHARIAYHLVLITLLVAATATDWREYVIPDQITLP